MRISFWVFPFFWVLSFSLLQAEHEGKLQLLMLGDSTTEGGVPRRLQPEGPHLEQVLEKLLNAEKDLPSCQVINSSRSGETIRRLIDSGRYERDVSKLPGIDYVIFRYGINDRAKREDFSENFPRDIRELIGLLRRDHPDALIIPSTVIPFSSPEASGEMNELIQAVAEEEELPVFDIYPHYAEALKAGPNMLNYRRYPLEKIPEAFREWLAPRVHGGKLEVMDNEFDALFGDLPGWFSDRHPNLAGYNVIAAETAKYLIPVLREDNGTDRKVVALIGDSTVTDAAGWGKAFALHFGDEVIVKNFAASGRSSKSWLAEDRMEAVLDAKPDYALIQFGHNGQPGKGPERETDPATTYRNYLRTYVKTLREVGAEPILVSSVTRRDFTAQGKIATKAPADGGSESGKTLPLQPWADAAREVASELGVPFVDLYRLSVAYHNQVGKAKSEEFSPKEGDITHFNDKGAEAISGLVVEELRRIDTPLSRLLSAGE